MGHDCPPVLHPSRSRVGAGKSFTPGVFVLTDPADQSVSVRSQAVDGRLEVIDLETNAAQAQLVGHRGGRSGLVLGPDEPCELDPGSSVGRPQHDDLRPRVWDADDRVYELALHERAALDLETQAGKERRHRVEVGDGDSDVVELPDVCHDFHPPVLVWSLVRGRSFPGMPMNARQSTSRYSGCEFADSRPLWCLTKGRVTLARQVRRPLGLVGVPDRGRWRRQPPRVRPYLGRLPLRH